MSALAAFRARRATKRLERAAAGDESAFRAFYRELYPEVAAFIARRVASTQDAEDLASRVFESVVRRLCSFEPGRGGARAWVFTIARNAVIDHHRAHAVRGGRTSVEVDAQPHRAQGQLDLLIDAERNRMLVHHLSKDALRARNVFSECDTSVVARLHNESHEQVAHADSFADLDEHA